MVRAPALHAGGWKFKSSIVLQKMRFKFLTAVNILFDKNQKINNSNNKVLCLIILLV